MNALRKLFFGAVAAIVVGGLFTVVGPLPKAHAATFTVTNTSGHPGVAGSLPWALEQANNNRNGFDRITFAIPGSGIRYIQLGGTLFINEPVSIDATSQPGYGGQPLVYVLGSGNISSIMLIGLTSGVTVRGFGMVWYRNNAITIMNGSTGNVIDGNWLGWAPSPTAIYKNSAYFPFTAGIGLQGSGNVISGNTISGVYNAVVVGEAVEGSWSGRGYEGNVIRDNRIGTDPSGRTTAGFGNDSDGVFFGAGVRNNWVGPGNVFAGNGSTGVELFHSSNTGNVVHLNKIGVDVSGTVALGNGDLGVQLSEGASYNSVWGNTISGNSKGGVAVGSFASGNWILNNVIGMDVTQTRAIGFQNVGVSINSGGARNAVRGNAIGGHREHGVIIADAQGNGVFNNWIGQGGGYRAVPNGAFGVFFLRASYNWVEGNAWGANGFGPVGQIASFANVIR